jgi:CubicO group peptidase (beta-lactamase class C family)
MSGDTVVQGTCDERFGQVLDAFRFNFDELRDVGASVAVTLDGQTVVDLWGGTCTTDAGERQPWEEDTIVNVWSSTKTMSYIVTLMLADRGLLDLDAPVADVWPEFAVNGKGAINTKHLLAHAAGLPGFELPGTPDDLYDWELSTSRLAAQTPWWEPGTASGYHAITQGFLLGEVCRRVTGRTMSEYFATELAEPLGAGFHIGTPAEHDAHVAHVIPPPHILGGLAPADSMGAKALSTLPLGAEVSNTIPWRRAEIAAAGGHGNARSIARVMAMFANHGTLDGRTYLSEAMCERIFEQQQYGEDLILLKPLRFGLGFGLGGEHKPLPNERCCYWGGWGGSLAFVDMVNRLSWSYAMNEMREYELDDERTANLMQAIYASLEATGVAGSTG